MSRRKITKEDIFEEVMIPSPNLRCQRKQQCNNGEIIPIGNPFGVLDLTGSLSHISLRGLHFKSHWAPDQESGHVYSKRS